MASIYSYSICVLLSLPYPISLSHTQDDSLSRASAASYVASRCDGTNVLIAVVVCSFQAKLEELGVDVQPLLDAIEDT